MPFLRHSDQVYRTGSGLQFDTQTACCLTDFFLALVALNCLMFVVDGGFSCSPRIVTCFKSWYLGYFGFLIVSSSLGGLAYDISNQAQLGFQVLHRNSSDLDLQRATVPVFGIELTHSTIDQLLKFLWRISSGSSIANNFALFGLFATQYLGKRRLLQVTMRIAIVVYALWIAVTIIWSKQWLVTLSVVPAVVLGASASVTALVFSGSNDKESSESFAAIRLRRRLWNELVVVVFTFAAYLVQARKIALSTHRFDHNALSHLLLAVAACLMLRNFIIDSPKAAVESSPKPKKHQYGTFTNTPEKLIGCVNR